MSPPAATAPATASSPQPPSKRRRVSSSAADLALNLPQTIKINVSGAYIIDHHSDSPSPPSPSSSLDSENEALNTLHSSDNGGYEHDRRDIRLPNHESVVSHVAADIGGSLAKVVYFSREVGRRKSGASGIEGVEDGAEAEDVRGGRLHFLRFETERIDACIEFMRELQTKQRAGWAVAKDGGNNKKRKEKEPELCVMATGGGAFKYYDRIKERLGVDVIREDEMSCLIQGLDFFITEIPNEVFTYHDELEDEQIQYRSIESQAAVYPYLLVNIGSGVSMIKVSGPDNFQRIGGTSLGGGTLWGLLSLLTGARTFDQMLAMADKGDNGSVDLLVGDIYGEGMGYEKIGLSEKTIASTFGKVFKRKAEAERNAEDGQLGGGKGENDQKESPDAEERVKNQVGEGRMFAPEDISRSLLYAVSNNIGQIAYLQSEKHNLKHIYFGGSFIRGHRQTIHTLSYAIKFWSKGSKQAYFLRHEGYLGAVGAFLKRQPRNFGRRGSSVGLRESVEEGEEQEQEKEMRYPSA